MARDLFDDLLDDENNDNDTHSSYVDKEKLNPVFIENSEKDFTFDNDFSLPFQSHEDEKLYSFPPEEQENISYEDVYLEDSISDDDWVWEEDENEVVSYPDNNIIQENEDIKQDKKENRKNHFLNILNNIKNDFSTQEDTSQEEKPQKNSPTKEKKIKFSSLNPYSLLCRAHLFILKKIISLFSFIPFIGSLFKKIIQKTKILTIISTILPFVEILILFFVIFNHITTPEERTTTFPDGGKVVVSEVKKKQDGISISLSNKGDVIAEGRVNIIEKSWKPHLFSPQTWIEMKDKKTSCFSDIISLDPETSTTLSLQCPLLTNNILTRLEGVFHEQ